MPATEAVWTHYPAPFWATCSQVYVWIWVLWFVPISKINLQKQRRKLPFLFVFFFLPIWMENFHFILRHGDCFCFSPVFEHSKDYGGLVLKILSPVVGKWQNLGTCAFFLFLLIILAWFIRLDLRLPVVKCCSLKVP